MLVSDAKYEEAINARLDAMSDNIKQIRNLVIAFAAGVFGTALTFYTVLNDTKMELKGELQAYRLEAHKNLTDATTELLAIDAVSTGQRSSVQTSLEEANRQLALIWEQLNALQERVARLDAEINDD